MAKVALIFLLALVGVGSAADSNSTAGLFEFLQNNQNITDIFENVAGIIGKVLSNSNTGTENVVNDVIKNLLGGANNGNTGAASDVLQLLQAVLPYMNGTGLPEVSQLLPQALNFVANNRNAFENVSSTCQRDVMQLVGALGNFEGWALKMIDAGFKPGSGLLEGNVKLLGNREECLDIQSEGSADESEVFHGKYCRILMPMNIPQLGPQNLLLGTCASHRCSNEDVATIVKKLISLITSGQMDHQTVYTSCIEDKELDTGAKVTIAILSILGFMVLTGTLYDVVFVQLATDDKEPAVTIPTNHQEPPPYKETGVGQNNEGYVSEKYELSVEMNGVADKSSPETQAPVTAVNKQHTKPTRGVAVNILLAFSVYTNGCKLLGTNQGSGTLGAINGIRFLSMAWVILGHTIYFAVQMTANMYRYGSVKLYQWTFMAIMYATVSVDSFFALSGTLVAYLTLREMKKAGGARKFNWFMFYFHRFWRLTPPYMLVMMVGTTLYKYIGSGAMKPDGDSHMMTTCRDNWWVNLLYINNYVHYNEQCMGWAWYLANDMQLYVLSPLLLLPLFYNAKIGGFLSAVVIGLAVAFSGIIANKDGYNVQGIPEAGPNPETFGKYFYTPVWTRFGPYAVGLVTGYILYRTKCKCKIPKVVNIACWIICIASICAIIYGPYSDHDSHVFTKGEEVAYNATFRTAWGFLICWIIFACATGNGGWINTVLSWSPFIPLGRLTYCAYLIHPLVMTMYYETLDVPIHFSDYTVVYIFLGHMALSYGGAFLTSLVFESPMMGLEKAIFKKK